MRKLMLGFLGFAFVFALGIPSQFAAQSQNPAVQMPRGSATDIKDAEIRALVRKTPGEAISDQALRIVSINGEYNIAVGVVHRAKTSGQAAGSAIEHSQITEIYHVIEGNATLVTGGTMDNLSEAPADSMTVSVLNGPSTRGSTVLNGVSRKIGPGDVVIIPPNTPHWFSEVTSDQIVYLIVRVDPHKVLPAGYVAK